MTNPCTCGRLHASDLDVMASALADDIIEDSVVTDVALACERAVIGHMTKRKRPRRVPDFESYYRFLAPYEARLKRGLSHVWEDQRRTILGNMRRTPIRAYGGKNKVLGQFVYNVKGLTFAELFEQWAFAKGPANKRLQVVYKDLALKLAVASALRDAKLYPMISTNWEVFNPNIEKWLKTHSIGLADEVNTATLDKLKGSLFEGWEKGESIPDLMNRVRDLYEEFDRSRAEMIARTETITASARGSIESWKSSGVVDRKMWVATPTEKTCEECMGLDGEVRDIDDTFFAPDGYSDGQGPTRHPSCRCAIVGILIGETVTDQGIE